MRMRAIVGCCAIAVSIAGFANAGTAASPLGADEVPFQQGMSFQIHKGATKAPPVAVPKTSFLELQFASALCRGSAMSAVLEITTVIGKPEQHFVRMEPVSGVGSAGQSPLAVYAEPGSQVTVQIHSKKATATGIGNPVPLPTCQVTLSGVMHPADSSASPSRVDKLGILAERGILNDATSGDGPGGTIRRSMQCISGSYATGCKANKCTREQGTGAFDGCKEFAQNCKDAGLTWTGSKEGDDAGGVCTVKQ